MCGLAFNAGTALDHNSTTAHCRGPGNNRAATALAGPCLIRVKSEDASNRAQSPSSSSARAEVAGFWNRGLRRERARIVSFPVSERGWSGLGLVWGAVELAGWDRMAEPEFGNFL